MNEKEAGTYELSTSDLSSLMNTIIDRSPEPEKILESMLKKISNQFIPKHEEMAAQFLVEWIDQTAVQMALLMASHLNNHPTHTSCPKKSLESGLEVFEQMTLQSFAQICEAEGWDNPFVENTNKETFEAVCKEFNIDTGDKNV